MTEQPLRFAMVMVLLAIVLNIVIGLILFAVFGVGRNVALARGGLIGTNLAASLATLWIRSRPR